MVGAILAVGFGLLLLPGPAAAQSPRRSTTTSAATPTTRVGGGPTTTVPPRLVGITPDAPAGVVGAVTGTAARANSVAWFAVDPVAPDQLRLGLVNSFLVREPSFEATVRIGRPDGDRIETLVRVQGQALSGVETSFRGGSASLPRPVTVEEPTDGVIGLPLPAVDTTPEGTVVWAEVRYRLDGSVVTAVSPAFRLDQLRVAEPGATTPAGWALIDPTGTAGAMVEIGPGPFVRADTEQLEVAFIAPPPKEVQGHAVLGAVSEIAVVAGGIDEAPVAVLVVDEVRRTLVARRGATAPSGTLPTSGAGEGETAIRVRAADLETVIGTRLAPGQRVGILRRLTLDDGEVLVAPGVLTPVGRAVATTTQLAPPETRLRRRDVDTSSSRPAVLAVLGVGSVLLAGMLVYWYRTSDAVALLRFNWRHRRRPEGGVRRPPPGVKRSPDPGDDAPEDGQAAP